MHPRLITLLIVLMAFTVPIPASDVDDYINSAAPNPADSRRGYERTHLNDVWAYYVDEHRWEELSPAGSPPAPMRNHPAIYDPINQQMLIGTGNSSTAKSYFGSKTLTLGLGTESWISDSPTSGTFILVSNYDGFYSASMQSAISWNPYDLYFWNLQTNTAGTIPVPLLISPKLFHGAAVTATGEDAYVYGGGPSTDLWHINLRPGFESINAVSAGGDTVPPAKWLVRPAFDSARNRFIMYGGNSFSGWTGGDYRDTTFELDVSNPPTWHLIPTAIAPSARGQYGVAWDEAQRVMYIFGGLYRVGPDLENVITYNEIWAYNSTNQSWHQELPAGAKPEARRQPGVVFDALNRRIVVFGGERIRPVSAVRTTIVSPLNGRKITGNSVTVAATLTTGTPTDAGDVSFEYRQPSITGAWTAIPTASARPNPDMDAPFYIHWNTLNLPEGAVDLRAVARDTFGTADTAPDETTIVISHSDADTTESISLGGHVETSYIVQGGEFVDVAIADGQPSGSGLVDANVRIRIPADTLTTGTVLHATFDDLANHPSLNIDGNIGFVADITVNNGSITLSQPAVLHFQYPDDNQDGIVDGTNVHETTLSIYTPDGLGGLEELQNVYIDVNANTIQGEVSHFSLFSVIGFPSTSVKDWSLR